MVTTVDFGFDGLLLQESSMVKLVTRVLLALTQKDLEKHDLYPLFALSAGLMGHKEARVFLASPLTVAASAVMGVITDPRDMLR